MAAMSAGPPRSTRRLERPPADRFRDQVEEESPAPQGSPGRAVGAAVAGAVATAALTVLLGGVLAVSAGLLVLWASGGYAIGLVTRLQSGTALSARRRRGIALTAAVLGVLLGQVGLWWFASTEGGVLPVVEYLAQTFGLLVPLQVVLAAAGAWWGSR